MKIAFGCKMGVGKDTAADYLISKYGGQKHSFAKPLYDIMNYAQQVAGFDQVKDRQFLQYIGADWGRSKDPNVWINTAIRNTPEYSNVFLTDVRYPNELQALKENGWICVKIVRENIDKTRVGTGTQVHSSETALDGCPDEVWDYIIENNGTIEEFHEKLEDLVDRENISSSNSPNFPIVLLCIMLLMTRILVFACHPEYIK